MVKFIDNRTKRPGTAGRRRRRFASVNEPYWQCQDGRVVFHDSKCESEQQPSERTTITPSGPTTESDPCAPHSTANIDPNAWQDQIIQKGVGSASPAAYKMTTAQGVSPSPSHRGGGYNEVVSPSNEGTIHHSDQTLDTNFNNCNNESDLLNELQRLRDGLIAAEVELKEKSKALERFQQSQLDIQANFEKVKDENKAVALKLTESRSALLASQSKVAELELQVEKTKREHDEVRHEKDLKLAEQAMQIQILHEKLQSTEKERMDWIVKYRKENEERVSQQQRFAGLSLLLEETKREREQSEARWRKMIMTKLDKGQDNWNLRVDETNSQSVSPGRSSRVELVEISEMKAIRAKKRARTGLLRESRASLQSMVSTLDCHSSCTNDTRSERTKSSVPTYMGRPLIKLERLLRRSHRTTSKKRRLVLEDSPGRKTVEEEI